MKPTFISPWKLHHFGSGDGGEDGALPRWVPAVYFLCASASFMSSILVPEVLGVPKAQGTPKG